MKLSIFITLMLIAYSIIKQMYSLYREDLFLMELEVLDNQERYNDMREKR